jgi:Zn-dependent peptidase ImmA (M78 family)
MSTCSPEFFAQQLLYDLNIEDTPIDPFEICRNLKIDIYYESMTQSEAFLFIKNGSKRIVLNKDMSCQSRHRFTLAHEIGHYWIPSHNSQTYFCEISDVVLFKSNKIHEQEANHFASELLIPTKFVTADAKNHDYNVKSIKAMASKYDVSITAAAIKLIEFTLDRAAIVLSQNGTIKWSAQSKTFGYYIGKSIPLNERTYIFDFYNEGKIDESLHQTYSNAWIKGECDMEFINEQSILMPNFNMALTVLTIPFGDEDMDLLTT